MVKGLVVEGETVVFGDKQLDASELYFLVVDGFELGKCVSRLKIFIFEGRLFFNPLLAPGDSVLVAGHFGGNDSIFVELLFFGVEDLDGVLIALGEFFNFPPCPLRFLNLLFDVFGNLVFLLPAQIDKGVDFVEVNPAFQTLLERPDPLFHVFFLCVPESLDMIINFFFHFIVGNSEGVMASVGVILEVVGKEDVELGFGVVVVHVVEEVDRFGSGSFARY